jgi:hypothetical protein
MMKRMGIGFLFWACLIHGFSASDVMGQAANNPVSHDTSGDDPLESVRSVLLQKIRIPLRLPKFLPDSGDKEHPIFAILESENPSSYEIQLAWTNDCNGGNSCHYGTIRGSKVPLTENEGRRKVPVRLRGGIKGYFVDTTCGAHCDDSTVGWIEGGYYYSVSLKAEKMEVLVRVANSAIANGQTTKP